MTSTQYAQPAHNSAAAAFASEKGLGGTHKRTNISPQAFAVFAGEAMANAVNGSTSNSAEDKWKIFEPSLLKLCTAAGDPLASRLVMVCNPTVVGTGTWFFENVSDRLTFFETGGDGFRYLAIVF
jgi:hypothetical protein